MWGKVKFHFHIKTILNFKITWGITRPIKVVNAVVLTKDFSSVMSNAVLSVNE